MFESLVDLASASAWTYAVVFGFAVLDAIAPIVPSETLVVASAALAASGQLSLALVLVAAAAGAFIGDNTVYLIGRASSERVEGWAKKSHGRDKRLAAAKRQLEVRGATIIVVSRFVPGGRTATMLAAGVAMLPWRRFAVFDLLAAAIWSLYSGLIGFSGGTAFEDEPIVGVALALGLAVVLGLLIEALRRLLRRRRRLRSRSDFAMADERAVEAAPQAPNATSEATSVD